MYKIVDFSHKLIIDYLNDNKLTTPIILDATCGLGNDTYFLANLLNNKGIIDAVDIQDAAINSTKEKTKDFSNVNVTKLDHSLIDYSKYDIVLFNLGYLPTFDKSITTKESTTLIAINKILKIMETKPLLCVICVYPGHEEGLKESIALDKLFKKLNSSLYLVSRYESYNQNNSPYLYSIKRKH